MDKINAVITGVGGYVPEDVLTNEDISKLVDTTDEWIMTRVGIKERRILKGEGLGTSYMGIRAVKQLLEKTNVNPEEIEVILTATTTPDHHFPTTSSIIAYHTGCKNIQLEYTLPKSLLSPAGISVTLFPVWFRR